MENIYNDLNKLLACQRGYAKMVRAHAEDMLECAVETEAKIDEAMERWELEKLKKKYER